MPLEIIRNDITRVHADAIVNAANPSLLGGGGVDGAIHRAAGPLLLEECRTLGGCKVGEAKMTKGYGLPAPHVIHVVGPVWQGGEKGEEALLMQCYENALTLAKERGLESIAFPLISTGVYGYPKDEALRIAIAAIGSFLMKTEMTVYLVVYDKAAFMLSEKLFAEITQYIDDRYEEEHQDPYPRSRMASRLQHSLELDEIQYMDIAPPMESEKRSLEDVMKQLEETFSQRLLRLIDEKGMTDAEAYKRANADRKHFSKIRNDVHYQPSKQTAIAFAIALSLSLDEAKDLLGTAGFALTRSSRFDLIIEYFLEEESTNIFEVNEALFAFGEKTLGS